MTATVDLIIDGYDRHTRGSVSKTKNAMIMPAEWYGPFLPQHKTCIYSKPVKTYQWKQASDCGARAKKTYGANPEQWNVSDHRAADLVVINLGTNDHRKGNEVAPDDFYDSYVKLIEEVHEAWPQANIIIMVYPLSSSVTHFNALLPLTYNSMDD